MFKYKQEIYMYFKKSSGDFFFYKTVKTDTQQ